VPGAAPGHGGINHHIGWCEACWVSSDLDSFQVDHDLAGRDPDRHAPAGKARRDRVVDIAHPDEPILLHPDLGVPVDVGQRISKRRQEAAFGGQRVAHPAAHSPVVAPEATPWAQASCWACRSWRLAKPRSGKKERSR
jgi:hypothetical protein